MNQMNIHELKLLAKEHRIKAYYKLNKPQLIDAIVDSGILIIAPWPVEEEFPNYRCRHNKYKYHCKDCHGSQICEHKKSRSYCKQCKGLQICPHNRIKYECRNCHGKAFCIHNKNKKNCKECKKIE